MVFLHWLTSVSLSSSLCGRTVMSSKVFGLAQNSLLAGSTVLLVQLVKLMRPTAFWRKKTKQKHTESVITVFWDSVYIWIKMVGDQWWFCPKVVSSKTSPRINITSMCELEPVRGVILKFHQILCLSCVWLPSNLMCCVCVCMRLHQSGLDALLWQSRGFWVTCSATTAIDLNGHNLEWLVQLFCIQ